MQSADKILNRLRNALNIETDSKLARYLGVKPSTISSWRVRDSLDYNLLFTKCVDINANWLLYGEGAVKKESVRLSGQLNENVVGSARRSDQAHDLNRTAYEPNIDYEPTEFVAVPFYPEVYASGGNGLVTENERSIEIIFRRHFFSNTLQTSSKYCYMIRLKGDSMVPLYPDGADLLIDSSRVIPKEGPGYLVRIEDALYVKMISKLPGGRLRLSSINSNYEPFEVTFLENGFDVMGEVVWHATTSRFL